MTDTTNLRLPNIEASQAQKHVTHNDALRILDALVQLAVADRDLSGPPASPAEGQRWIVKSPGTGAWAGHDNAVAAWQDGAWTFYAPQTGWLAYALDEGAMIGWNGSAWTDAIAAPGALNNLTQLGIGTAADDVNPISARLNNVLFAAKTAAEGGDGTLRYKLSKENVAGTLSFLFQDNFSARAEIGLTGDDDFHFKVSPDGVTWSDALVLDGGSGSAVLNAPATFRIDSGVAIDVDLQEGDSVFRATRYAESSNAPVFFGRKARGTRVAPTAVQAGDTLIGFRGYGYTGTQFVSGPAGAAFLLEAAETWTDTAFGTQIRFFTTSAGTTVDVERLRIADSGDLQMGGANTVINASRHPVLRAYTVAMLPDASTPGQLIYVSDGTSGKRIAVSDGIGWLFPDGSAVA